MTAQQPPTYALSELYEQDFYLWIQTTADLLKQKDFTQLDLDNLIEEIELMGRSEKWALRSHLEILFMNLLKYQFQVGWRSESWKYTVSTHRREVQKDLKENPSLKPYFYEILDESYESARNLALIETGMGLSTFPETLSFTPAQILDPDFFPDE
jgi:Domain of unknown function DUF29